MLCYTLGQTATVVNRKVGSNSRGETTYMDEVAVEYFQELVTPLVTAAETVQS